MREFLRRYQAQDPEKRKSWTNVDIRESIQRELDFEEPVLRGPVEVAKGETPTLAIYSEQAEAAAIVFNTVGSALRMFPYYALIEGTDPESKQIEVNIKYVSSVRPKTPDHFILSAAAARNLGLRPNAEIRIKSIYQKVEDIDLDQL